MRYEFGLKKLTKEVRVEARIKSLFTLKPQTQKKCELSPLEFVVSTISPFFAYGLIGKHMTDCNGPWSITEADMKIVSGKPLDIWSCNIINQRIASSITNDIYDAGIEIISWTDEEVFLGFKYRDDGIEVHGILWRYLEDDIIVSYTLQNPLQSFNCSVTLLLQP